MLHCFSFVVVFGSFFPGRFVASLLRRQFHDCELFIQEAIPKAEAQLKETANRSVEISIDRDNFLTPDSCGGVEMCNRIRTIKVRNTLDSRLELIGKQVSRNIATIILGSDKALKLPQFTALGLASCKR